MKAKIIANRNFEIGMVDKRLYGSFIEHLGRAVSMSPVTKRRMRTAFAAM